MQNYINLYEIVKILEDENISKEYVYYINNNQSQYRHREIQNLYEFLKITELSKGHAEGFLFGYEIPQLNKEFDLIKTADNLCVNVELKGGNVPLEKVRKQLLLNQHYLKMLDRELFLCTYFANSNKFFTLKEDELIEINLEEVKSRLKIKTFKTLDLNEVFSPQNILVSPLNNTEKFMAGKYLLTENQQNIKNTIIDLVFNNKDSKFIGLTGNAGTGKTLLTFDIAKTISKHKNTLIIHGGILSEGHILLSEKLENITIIPAKNWNIEKEGEYDLIIMDESHRIYSSTIDDIKNYVIERNIHAIFSYDEKQRLSNFEFNSQTVEKIKEMCENHDYRLTNKIRTNKELAFFITCLMDLSKIESNYTFENVEIKYIPDKIEAHKFGHYLEKERGYTYITYTPSQYNSGLGYQDGPNNTHRVIGQEFDKVCMVLDDNFSYRDNKLVSKRHPNPDYLFHQLLYQGLTRVRTKLFLIIRDLTILENVLKILNNKKSI